MYTHSTATFHMTIGSVQKLESGKDSPGLSWLRLQLTMPYGSRYLSSSIFITRLFASKTEMFLNFNSLTVRNMKLLLMTTLLLEPLCFPLCYSQRQGLPTLRLGTNQMLLQYVGTVNDKALCTVNGEASIISTYFWQEVTSCIYQISLA